MMTPGFHALKNKYPKAEIYLAIPKRYFSIFQGNEDVKLLDIENEDIDVFSYDRWYNLTDCPAARIESMTVPNVRKSRIEIFARSVGITYLEWLFFKEKKPRYFVTQQEREFAQKFWEERQMQNCYVIGIQLRSGDTYKDYPHLEALIDLLVQRNDKVKILLFHSSKIEGFEMRNVLKIDDFSLRKALSLASKCDLIVSPCSAFIHFAACFNLPTVALYGPTDGRVFTKYYPKCVYIDVRDQLKCVPCWRNEDLPCKLTGRRESVCLKTIKPERVVEVVNAILEGKFVFNENVKKRWVSGS